MRILIAGDFVPYKRAATLIDNGRFDCLDEVKPIISKVDYAIVNFESPVVIRDSAPINKTGPNLRCSERAIECVAQAGFQCVTLANNHFRDYGQIGVEDTLIVCQKYGVDYVGGGKDINDAKRIHYKRIGDRLLAILNFCENEWSIASTEYGGSNPLNPVSNFYSIVEARNNADYVIVIVHGGIELYQLPTPRMVDTYRFFIDAGADAVVNHHQHCYSGYEMYKGRPIFYGLGNFFFDKISNSVEVNKQHSRLWEEGFMVELLFEDKVSVKLHPYSQCSKDSATVQLLDPLAFEGKLKELCSIIIDRLSLERDFYRIAEKGNYTVNSILTPYSSSMAKRLVSKHLLPSFINIDRIKRLLGNLQCESHRDVLYYSLNKMMKNSK